MNLDDANLSTSLHEVSKSIGSIRSGANNNSMHQYLLQRSISNNSSFISHADGNSTSGAAASPPHLAMIATSPLQHSFSQALRAPRAVRPDESSLLAFNDTFSNQTTHATNALSPLSSPSSNAAGSSAMLSPGADSSSISARVGGGARRMLTDYGKRVMERRAAEAEAAAPVSVEPSIESSNNLNASSFVSNSKKQISGIKKGSSKPILFSAKTFHTPKKGKTVVTVKQPPPQQTLEGRSPTRPEFDAGDHRPKLRPSFEFEYDVIGPVELSTVSQSKIDNLVSDENVLSSSSSFSHNPVNASPSKMMAWFGQQRQIPGFLVPQVSEFSPSALLFEQQQQHLQLAQQQRLDTVLEGASPVTSEGTRRDSILRSQQASTSSESLGSCSTRTLPVPDVPMMALRSVAGPFFTKKAETVTQGKNTSSSPRSLKYAAAPQVPSLTRKPAVPTFSQSSPNKRQVNAWDGSISQNDSKKPLSPYAVKLTTSTKRSSPIKKSFSPQQQQFDYRIQTAFGKTRVERVPVTAAAPFASPASPPNARVKVVFSERMTSQPDFSSAIEGGEESSLGGGSVLGVEAAYNDYIKSNQIKARDDVDLEAGEGNDSVSNIAANNDDVVIDVEEIYDTEYGVTLSPRHGIDSEADEDEDDLDLPPMPRPLILHGVTWNDGATAPKRTPSKDTSSTKTPILPVASTWRAASSSTALFVDAPKAVVLEAPKVTSTTRTPLTSRYTAPAQPRRVLFTTSSSALSNASMMMKKKSAMTPSSPPSAAHGSPFTPPNGSRYPSSPLSQSPYSKKASFKPSASKLSAVDAKERAQRLRTLSTLIESNKNKYSTWMWDQTMGRSGEGV